jgi:cytoskeletal protein RodZ
VAGDDEPNWQDQGAIVVSAGVAALILVALLVYGVMRTSDSAKVPETVPIPSSSATPSTYTTSSTSTTSYSVPSVQTSEDNPVVTPPAPTPRVEQSTTTTEPTTTTTTFRYPSTTTFPYPTGGF